MLNESLPLVLLLLLIKKGPLIKALLKPVVFQHFSDIRRIAWHEHHPRHSHPSGIWVSRESHIVSPQDRFLQIKTYQETQVQSSQILWKK